jgi:hypothetical protein
MLNIRLALGLANNINLLSPFASNPYSRPFILLRKALRLALSLITLISFEILLSSNDKTTPDPNLIHTSRLLPTSFNFSWMEPFLPRFPNPSVARSYFLALHPSAPYLSLPSLTSLAS